MQLPAPSHVSSVHGWLSSQSLTFEMHSPFLQKPVPVRLHGFGSWHSPSCGVCTQPTAGTQLSTVQSFKSSQFVTPAGPSGGMHAPVEQFSLMVHALWSSHTPVVGISLQPVSGLHE